MRWRSTSLSVLVLLTMLLFGFMVLVEGLVPQSGDWISDHRVEAENYSKTLLAGSIIPVPDSLKSYHVESGDDYVSFTIGGGPWASFGFAYSTSGHRPNSGLGGEPSLTRWQKVEDNWYRWGAD